MLIRSIMVMMQNDPDKAERFIVCGCEGDEDRVKVFSLIRDLFIDSGSSIHP